MGLNWGKLRGKKEEYLPRDSAIVVSLNLLSSDFSPQKALNFLA